MLVVRSRTSGKSSVVGALHIEYPRDEGRELNPWVLVRGGEQQHIMYADHEIQCSIVAYTVYLIRLVIYSVVASNIPSHTGDDHQHLYWCVRLYLA